LLQRGGLQIAAGLKHGPDLVAEMAGMRVKVGCEGREQYGAWREGTHDDLVFAVALAYWAARKLYPREPAGKEGYWRFREWRDCEREFRKEMQGRAGWGGAVRDGGGEGEGVSDEQVPAGRGHTEEEALTPECEICHRRYFPDRVLSMSCVALPQKNRREGMRVGVVVAVPSDAEHIFPLNRNNRALEQFPREP